MKYRPSQRGHKKSHVEQQYYIPMVCVPNFIEDMECGREGAHYMFTMNKETRGPNQSQDGHKTALELRRYVYHSHVVSCHYYKAGATLAMQQRVWMTHFTFLLHGSPISLNLTSKKIVYHHNSFIDLLLTVATTM